MLRTVATRIARRAAASASSSSPRCFAAAAQGKGDLVKDFFADSQRKFRAYAEKSKTNPLPLDGDEAKLKAYVEKNKQIMAEVRIRRLCSIFFVLIEENSIFFILAFHRVLCQNAPMMDVALLLFRNKIDDNADSLLSSLKSLRNRLVFRP